MNQGINSPRTTQDNDVRDIPKWAHRYAQNRALPMLVFFAIFVVGFAAFGVLSYLTALAWSTGQRALMVAAMVLIGGFAAWWIWFSCVGGPRIMRRITQRLYRSEGAVSPRPFPEQNWPSRLQSPLQSCLREAVLSSGLHLWWRSPAVGFVLMSWVLASVGLGPLGVFPMRYIQPLSTPYIPFLALVISQRPDPSPFMWLWPTLYGIHGVLIMAGVPLYFGGNWYALNIFVPLIGYGVIAALAAHMYSRYALRRLRTLATSPETPAQSIEGGRS